MNLAIIDGTGDYNDVDYALGMRHSFCRQMYSQNEGHVPASVSPIMRGLRTHYERGPSIEGYRIEERGQRAYEFLHGLKRRDARTPLFLAGYSRGASSAIIAAEMLQQVDIKVQAMFLFDPVARHQSHGGVVVPANVRNVWTARRSLDAALIKKYDHTIGTSLPIIGRQIAHNPMRVFFGMTATTYLGLAHHAHQKSFSGSHGALGGVGWTHVIEDAPCQVGVARWMSAAAAAVGLPILLHSYAPTATP